MLNADELRHAFTCISPIVLLRQVRALAQARAHDPHPYDRTFLPEFSRKIADEFRQRKLEAEIRCLPCGHYTLGESPYKYMDGYLVTRFVARAFNRAYSATRSAEPASLEVSS